MPPTRIAGGVAVSITPVTVGAIGFVTLTSAVAVAPGWDVSRLVAVISAEPEFADAV